MKVKEFVNEYFAQTLTIVNKMRVYGEKMEDIVVVEKILSSMTPKYNYIDVLLHNSLLVHEQHLNGLIVEEKTFEVTYEDQLKGGGQGRGRFRNRDKQRSDKPTFKYYKFHELGHFQYECSDKETEIKSYHIEASGKMSLMAYLDAKKASKEKLWFLDLSCNNYMCGEIELFTTLDESFSTYIKLRDNSSMVMVEKENI
jgi:hypothetical protein